MICGFSLRLLWSSRIVKKTISRPKATLVAFIKETLVGEFYIDLASGSSTRAEMEDLTIAADRSLAEKPKVGELQMDWLRSEDLKEEKNVTASASIITAEGTIAPCRCPGSTRRTIGHEQNTSRMP
jgi:hypothetical protein